MSLRTTRYPSRVLIPHLKRIATPCLYGFSYFSSLQFLFEHACWSSTCATPTEIRQRIRFPHKGWVGIEGGWKIASLVDRNYCQSGSPAITFSNLPLSLSCGCVSMSASTLGCPPESLTSDATCWWFGRLVRFGHIVFPQVQVGALMISYPVFVAQRSRRAEG